MKNLVVYPSPASVTTEGVRLPAQVFLNYYSDQSGDGEELVYATHSYLLAPAQARALAIELAVAAERADGNSEAGTSLLAAMLKDVLPKKTAATGASAGGGLAGDGQAGESAEGVSGDGVNVAPAGPARGGERPENRGGTGVLEWPCSDCGTTARSRSDCPFCRRLAERSATKASDMTDGQLAALIRGVHAAVDQSDESTIAAAVQPLRDAGIVCGPYRGAKARESTRNTMLWYAGEIVDIVDQDKLFAVNSWVNTVDKFVPTGGAL